MAVSYFIFDLLPRGTCQPLAIAVLSLPSSAVVSLVAQGSKSGSLPNKERESAAIEKGHGAPRSAKRNTKRLRCDEATLALATDSHNDDAR